MNLKDRFYNFMRGRYGERGMDELTRFLLIAVLICLVLDIFIPGPVGSVLGFLGTLGLIYCWFRILSRNIVRRYDENQKYLSVTAGLRRRLISEKNILKQRKDYHIYSCPGCGQKIRIPRGKKGSIEISCPKCHTKFVKNQRW